MNDSTGDGRPPVSARLYDRLNAGAETKVFPEHRRWLAAGLTGDVLDLGVGTGAMLPYYSRLAGPCEITGIDPDQRRLDAAEKKQDGEGRTVRFVAGRAEALPFESAAFDVVVASLVLCSVRDLTQSLEEIRRVLRPTGEFRFLEHVRTDGLRGAVERTVAPVWAPVVGGCRIDRETGSAIRSMFEVVEMEAFDIGTVHTFPVKRFVRGRATA